MPPLSSILHKPLPVPPSTSSPSSPPELLTTTTPSITASILAKDFLSLPVPILHHTLLTTDSSFPTSYTTNHNTHKTNNHSSHTPNSHNPPLEPSNPKTKTTTFKATAKSVSFHPHPQLFPPSPSSPIFPSYPAVIISPAPDGAGAGSPPPSLHHFSAAESGRRGSKHRKTTSMDDGAFGRLGGGVVRRGSRMGTAGMGMGHVRRKSKTE